MKVLIQKYYITQKHMFILGACDFILKIHVALYKKLTTKRETITEHYRLLDSLVVECWLRVREVLGSIPSQGPRHTKDVIKMVPVVPLFSTQH